MSKKSKRRGSRSRRTRRTRRGGAALEGAPLSYHLAGDWSSRMSLGQGVDYFKYHQGQHGGAGYSVDPAPLSAITQSELPGSLRASAHIGGIDQAIADVRGLSDQKGGRRKRCKVCHCKSCKCKKSHKHSHKHSHKRSHKCSHKCKKSHKHGSKHGSRGKHGRKHHHTRRRGGTLEYAPISANPRLLDAAGYTKAGLNPEWNTDVAYDMAKIRQSQ